MDREFEKMDQKKLIFFSIEKLSKAWGPHKCHRTEILRSVPEIMDREFDNKMVQKKLIFFFYRKIV